MPAITVDDPTTLARLRTPGLGEQPRPVRQVTTAPRGVEGEGFPVRRAFAGADLRDLDPFLHLDQMGEVEYAPGEPKGTAWHPHRGFETVTYMVDGVMDHQDSTGGGGSITDGDTQWMTAGSGLLHKEAPPEWLVAQGGLFHGLQLWVNLPRDAKWSQPRYQDIRGSEIALATSGDAGALVRLVAGELPGEAGPVTGPGSTCTPMTMVHATLAPGARLELPWPTAFNALAYVLSGRGSVGAKSAGRAAVGAGQLAVLGAGDYLTLAADDAQDSRTPALDVVLLGGRPIREAVAWAGPFVMNTKAEVMEAYEDFRRGRMGVHPTIHGELGNL